MHKTCSKFVWGAIPLKIIEMSWKSKDVYGIVEITYVDIFDKICDEQNSLKCDSEYLQNEHFIPPLFNLP